MHEHEVMLALDPRWQNWLGSLGETCQQFEHMEHNCCLNHTSITGMLGMAMVLPVPMIENLSDIFGYEKHLSIPPGMNQIGRAHV